MIFWSVLIYAFAGCETASLMGDEIKNARRAIPRALLIGGVTVTFCYIVGTISVLVALPPSEMGNLQGLMQAISQTSHRVGFESIIPFAAFLIALSNVGAAGAYLAAVARLPFVAGIDKFLPPAFGALHPRWKTPWVGLLTQWAFGVLFIFLGQAGTGIKGAYDVLVSMQYAPYKLKGGDWDGQRAALGETVVKTLSQYAPGLAQLIESHQVITPKDLEETYGLTGGHIFHGELALDQFFTMLEVF